MRLDLLLGIGTSSFQGFLRPKITSSVSASAVILLKLAFTLRQGQSIDVKMAPIPNCEDRYIIGNKIFSKKLNREIKLTLASNGYLVFSAKNISKNEFTIFLFHRSKWEATKGLIPRGMWINHKDGDKLNNNIRNLEVVTPRENILHSINILGNNRKSFRKVDGDKILEIRKLLLEGLSLKDISVKLGICASILSHITRKNRRGYSDAGPEFKKLEIRIIGIRKRKNSYMAYAKIDHKQISLGSGPTIKSLNYVIGEFMKSNNSARTRWKRKSQS